MNKSPKKRRMLMRMLLRSIIRGRGRTLSALLAIIVAAAAATAMLNLFVDVQAKLHTEFRNYGANVIIVAKDGQYLPRTLSAKLNPLSQAAAWQFPLPTS